MTEVIRLHFDAQKCQGCQPRENVIQRTVKGSIINIIPFEWKMGEFAHFEKFLTIFVPLLIFKSRSSVICLSNQNTKNRYILYQDVLEFREA